MTLVRLREPVALLDPETGAHVVPRTTEYFDENAPLVKQHPWAFATDDELASASPTGIRESVVIEHGTAAPGEKRRTRRP
jgi:hypothetical protein